MSISALEKRGFEVKFRNGIVEIISKGTKIAVGKRANNLYHLSDIFTHMALVSDENAPRKTASVGDQGPAVASNNVENGDVDKDAEQPETPADKLFATIHARLGHPSKERIESLHQHVYGIPKLKAPPNFFCNECENNKMVRRIRKFQTRKEVLPGRRLYTDVWGPYRTRNPIPGIGEVRYYLSIIDEGTG